MTWSSSKEVSWQQITILVSNLAQKLQKNGQEYDELYTISRGGLVPARLLADELGIKKILVDKKKIPPNSLIVDDIFDTGVTFEKILDHSTSDFTYATLYARKGKKYPKQLVYAKKTSGNEYIVFPWEVHEHKRSKN